MDETWKKTVESQLGSTVSQVPTLLPGKTS